MLDLNIFKFYHQVLPFFMCSENNTEIERIGRAYHGTGGPLTVERFPWQPPITNDILSAVKLRGHYVSEDLNGELYKGFTVAQTNSKDGTRVSSARAFLAPARHRPNLHVALNATVTKILIENAKATGVEYYQVSRL